MSPTRTDPAHYLDWKKNGWLAPYVPEDVAKHFPADQVDPDGMHATSCAWMEAIGYNTNLVKREDAPKSYADLLDPKWQGKIVKAHPGYSGAIMTATFVLARDLGWPYLEKLAQQKVMQVQSAADPPKKILLGERAVMADGNDYNLVLLKDQGKPVEVVYADRRLAADHRSQRRVQGRAQSERGTAVPELLLQRRNPADAGRRLRASLVSRAGQGEGPGTCRCPRSNCSRPIRPQVQAQSEEIKARYTKILGCRASERELALRKTKGAPSGAPFAFSCRDSSGGSPANNHSE